MDEQQLAQFCNALTPLTVKMDILGTRPLTVFLGLILLLGVTLWHYRHFLSLPIALAWFYFLAYAVFVASFPAETYGCYQRAFEASAGQAFLELALLPLAVLVVPEKIRKWMWHAVAFLVVIDLPAIWLHRNGLMIGPSFDLVFLAMYLPFARLPLAIAILATIGFTHGTTALVMVAAEVGVLVAVKNRGWPWRTQLSVWGLFFFLVAALGVVAAWHSEGELFTRSVRVHGYAQHMGFWLYGKPGALGWPIRWAEISWPLVLIGTGVGSFTWISLLLAKFQPPFNLQLHSDWLQITADTGLFGLAAFLAVAWRVVKSTFKRVSEDPRLLSALAGIAVSMLTYHPFRFFPTMLLITLVAHRALFPPKQGWAVHF